MELIVDIDNGDNYLNIYNKNKLSESLYNYILDEVKGMPLNEKVLIKVYSNYELTGIEKENFVEMVKSNFGLEEKEEKIKFKYLCVKSGLLFFIGIFCIIVAFYLKQYDVAVLNELVSIIGWVGIWEGVYILLFDEMAKRIKMHRLKQIIDAEITFDNKVL